MSAPITVNVLDDLDAVAQNAADALGVLISERVAQRGEASIVLTGGTVGIEMLRRLADEPGIDWRAVRFFFGDERFVPADSPDRNEGQARAALLDRVGTDPARIYAMPASDGPLGDNAEAAAMAYAQTLASLSGSSELPHFDVHLLGMGPDGHINSLFPGFAQLDEAARTVVAVHDSPKPPPDRLTLTYSAVHSADEVWVLATGAAKAEAAKAALEGEDFHQVPAAAARGRVATRWFTDAESAALLD